MSSKDRCVKLYIIGLGLYLKQITLEALEILRDRCEKIFAEEYTSISSRGGIEDLEKIIGKKIIRVSRKDLEDLNGEILLKNLRENVDTCLITWGDPMTATTHVSIAKRAVEEGFCIRYVPGISSIHAALGFTGLMIYRLGKISTITFPKDNILSEYPYHVLRENMIRGLHTLYLLDIDVEKKIFMRASDAVRILLELEERFRENLFNEKSFVLGIHIDEDTIICGGEAKFMLKDPLKEVPQILIVPSKLFVTEDEYIRSLGLKYDRCITIS